MNTEIKEGLGGWLLLIGISMILSVFIIIYNTYDSIQIFTDGTAYLLDDPESEIFTPGYLVLLKMEVIFQLLILGSILHLIFLYLNKSVYFPIVYIIFNIILLSYIFVEIALFQRLEYSPLMQEAINEVIADLKRNLIVSVISTGVWILYLLKSNRVKSTFVNRIY